MTNEVLLGHLIPVQLQRGERRRREQRGERGVKDRRGRGKEKEGREGRVRGRKSGVKI